MAFYSFIPESDELLLRVRISSLPGDPSLSQNHWSVLYLAAAKCDSSSLWQQISHRVDFIPSGLAADLSLGGGSDLSLYSASGCWLSDSRQRCFVLGVFFFFFFLFPHLICLPQICTSSPVRFSLFILFLRARTFVLIFFSFQHPDINECLSAHACQPNERCVNTAGSYACQRLITCPPGYQINSDICEGTPHLISI